MSRFAVRTLTLNPSIDVSSEAERVEPERKVRTCCERIDPGGGGINVARVLQRLGTSVEAVYLAGGATGDAPTITGMIRTLRRDRPRTTGRLDDTRGTARADDERMTGAVR